MLGPGWGGGGVVKLPFQSKIAQKEWLTTPAFLLSWARGRGSIGAKGDASLRNYLDLNLTLGC